MIRIAAILISVLFAARADAAAPQRKPPVPERQRADAGTDRQVKNA